MCPELSVLASARGWQYVGADYNSEVFGNAYVSLEAETFRLIVFTDRGEYFADIGPRAGADKYDLAGLLHYLGIWSPNSISPPTAERLNAIAVAMRENIGRVSMLFNGNNLRESGFIAYENDRRKADLDRLRQMAQRVRMQKK